MTLDGGRRGEEEFFINTEYWNYELKSLIPRNPMLTGIFQIPGDFIVSPGDREIHRFSGRLPGKSGVLECMH